MSSICKCRYGNFIYIIFQVFQALISDIDVKLYVNPLEVEKGVLILSKKSPKFKYTVMPILCLMCLRHRSFAMD